MKKFKLLAAIAATGIPFSLMATSCGHSENRDIYRNVSLNEGWTFKLNDQKQATNINLPHDFSIIQDFVKPDSQSKEKLNTSGSTGFLPGGIGHYHKEFELPDRYDPTVILNFDGAYNDTEVKVNGKVVGNNKYGYNPFAFDITNYVKVGGKNTIDVTVKHEHITSSRWYPGSGIYRDVNISMVDKLHVAHNGTYVSTPYIKSEYAKDAKVVTLNADVEIQNDYNTAMNVRLNNSVVEYKTGREIAGKSTDVQLVQPKSSLVFSSVIPVTKPALWSPSNPNLYYLKTEVYDENNNKLDEYQTRFGFRWFEWDQNGFKVNGNLTKIHGVCLHHDQGALGAVSNNDAMARQLDIMKEMGMNGVRTSHNCPDEDFLRLCDEKGMLVMDEAFDTWAYAKTIHDSSDIWNELVGKDNKNLIDGKADMTWHNFVMRSMVKRDRNCPSIFMWSLGNELHEGPWHDERLPEQEKRKIEKEMLGYGNELDEITRELDYDTHRWTGIALERNPNPGSDDENIPKCEIAKMLYHKGGVMGYNYGDRQQIEDSLGIGEGKTRLYDRVYGSETASATGARGVYCSLTPEDNADGHWHVPSYDIQGSALASEVIYRTLYYDGYAGQFVWTGFDYIGEPSPWCYNVEDDDPSYVKDWPWPNSSSYGIVDTCGFPKDSYYLYRAHLRQDDTTLHLVGSLNDKNMFKYPEKVEEEEDFPNGFTPIDIYTNAPTVKIYGEDGGAGEILLATITRKATQTSGKAGSYYIYEANSEAGPSVCVIQDTKIKKENGHGLYSNILVKPDSFKKIYAEALNAAGQKIENTVGLKELNTIDRTNSTKLVCKAEKDSITADGKSLAYVTVDLQDSKDTLITDYDSQECLEVSLDGNGTILGVDNGDQTTTQKFQSSSALLSPTSAKIYTFGGKALIIVGSTKEAGNIDLTIKSGNKEYTVHITTTAA